LRDAGHQQNHPSLGTDQVRRFRKIYIVTRCGECPETGCQWRHPGGAVPKNCPLPDADEIYKDPKSQKIITTYQP